MLEYTIFNSVLLFYLFSLFLLIILFFTEVSRSYGIMIAAVIGYSALIYFDSNIDYKNIFKVQYIPIYIGIGIIWSFYKTYLFGKKRSSAINKIEAIKGYNKNYEIKNSKDKLRDLVVHWIVLWPLSLLRYIFSSLFKDLYNWIYKKVSFIYNKIFDYALKKE